MRPLRELQGPRVATPEESGVLGFPSSNGDNLLFFGDIVKAFFKKIWYILSEKMNWSDGWKPGGREK